MKRLVVSGSLAVLLISPLPAVAEDQTTAPPLLAPTGVVAVRSGTGVEVSWQPVPEAAGYEVTAAPGGQVCSTIDATCSFTQLQPGVAHTFTVTASDAARVSLSSAPSRPVTLRAPRSQPSFDSSKVLVGRSVRGRKIWATRQGNPLADTILLTVGQMHGSEPAGLRVVDQIRDRTIGPEADYQLWTIRTMNPDGAARGDRYNAHGVDLNRNFPGTWSRNHYRSGRAAGSEPETRAMMRFVARLRPDGILSFHQPWDTVLSICDERSAYWVHRSASLIGLDPPGRPTRCGNWLPGTMNRWTSRNTSSWFVTVELAPNHRVAPQVPRSVAAVLRIAEEMAADSGPAMGLGSG